MERGKRRRLRRDMGILLAMAMIFQALPFGSFAVQAAGEQEMDICGHHMEHTEDCGYASAGECAFVCEECGSEGPKTDGAKKDDKEMLASIQEWVNALPEEVTGDNEEAVRQQLNEILSVFTELSEEAQEQVDLSRCYRLQNALDAANAPSLVEDIITTELDFTNVGNGDGQTPAEGPGYRWSGDAENGYLLELENFKMELPENTNMVNGGPIAITVPNKGQTTVLVKGENNIKVPGWNAIYAKLTNFAPDDPNADQDSIQIKGEGESATLIFEDTHTAIRATYALEIQNINMRILSDTELGFRGICTYYGDIGLKNVDVQMKIRSDDAACINAYQGNTTIQNSKIQLESDGFPPIFIRDGNLTVEDSELDLSSGYHSGIYIATDTPGRSNVFSGETTVSIDCTSSYGIFSKGNLAVEAPAKLAATGTSAALAVFEGIVLNGTAVTSPVDGIITPPVGGSNIHTVRAGNAAVASVEIKSAELAVSLDHAGSEYSYGSSAQATVTADANITATVSIYNGEKLLGTANLGEAIPINTQDLGSGSHTLTAKLQENKGDISKEFTLTVTKTVPAVTGPAASSLRYGQKLSESILTGGTAVNSETGESVEGTWAWKDGNLLPSVENDGYFAVFTPMDAGKYNTVETRVALTVNKAQNAPNMPENTMNVPNSIKKVGEVSLPEGWEWQEFDWDTPLKAGEPVSAVAVYTGADKGNYETETVTVTITRALCDHEAGDILYTGEGEKEPTCTENGCGHTECIKCGSIVEAEIIKKALGHTGGTATCSKKAVCTRCNQPYGDIDSSKHGDTEIRGVVKAACTAGGYTGDTYCRDCGAKMKTGKKTSALGHDYKSRVTKKPTTSSKGVRTYTCSRCGHSYTKSIPKLPEETHKHSYSDRVTKQPTCIDAGIRTYTCSCGDSYTKPIAALGHQYISKVTKEPTAAAEGVMTYTCSRCGDSYTKPIVKLSDSGRLGAGNIWPGAGNIRWPGVSQTGAKGTKNDSAKAGTGAGRPFIKGEAEKEGWDVIRAEEEKAKDGSTINIDMNGATVVPGDIFDLIKGRDITVVFDIGNGILWSVNGQSIVVDQAGDIDFSVSMDVAAIPVDIVNNVTGESYSVQISLAYDGEFGFTAVLSINLGKENASLTVKLYYYNQSIGELEYLGEDVAAKDGTVSFSFTHASDYVIVVDAEEEEGSEAMGQAGEEDVDGTAMGKGTASEAKTLTAGEGQKNGKERSIVWPIVALILILAGIVIVVLVMRKKKEEKGEKEAE